MSKTAGKRAATSSPKALARGVSTSEFAEVLRLIEAARGRAFAAVNQELVGLYWQIGECISRKLESAAWGEGVVEQLAAYIARMYPELRGFARANLFRMRQFYETYRGDEKVATLLRQLPWSHNLAILSRCKRDEEREFYLRMAAKERWSHRELQRQLNGALFERVVLNPTKVSPPVTQSHPDAAAVFKDSYLLDFLNLPEAHSEGDLERALVANLRQFLLELAGDFTFVGQRYRLQVGGRDFFVDLLFYHRGLTCLVALELKVEQFELGPRPTAVLPGGSRPRCEEGARTAVDRRLALRDERQRGRRIRPQSNRITRPGCRVPDASARQESAASQAARILRTGSGAEGAARQRRYETTQAAKGPQEMSALIAASRRRNLRRRRWALQVTDEHG